jgi:hypothetical protein
LELAAYLYLPVDLLPNQRPARRPDPHPMQQSDLEQRRVPGLVVGHGAGSRAARHEPFCLQACRRGFAVLALDFRGHGASRGQGDGPMEQDLVAAVRFLREHPAVDPDRVCYRGSSLGGFYGLKAAPLAGFAAMVLICPAGETVMLDALTEQETADIQRDTETRAAATRHTEALDGPPHPGGDDAPRWDRPRLRAYFERQDTKAIAAQVRCPVLLVHARPDKQVPLANSLLLAEHLPTDTTLVVLGSGSHTTAQHDPDIHAYTLAWLLTAIGQAGDRA